MPIRRGPWRNTFGLDRAKRLSISRQTINRRLKKLNGLFRVAFFAQIAVIETLLETGYQLFTFDRLFDLISIPRRCLRARNLHA